MQNPNAKSSEQSSYAIRVKKQRVPRICQGDVFKDIEYVEYISEKEGNLEVSRIIFPLVTVLTQDCDLEQDYNSRWSKKEDKKDQDKFLLSVLVAPMYNAEHVYQGEHLSELKMKMQKIKRKGTSGNDLRNNQKPRYHYLEFPPEIHIVPSVIDFKHYFSVNIKQLKKLKRTNFICSIPPLFREDISQRFASFLARIGLPNIEPRK